MHRRWVAFEAVSLSRRPAGLRRLSVTLSEHRIASSVERLGKSTLCGLRMPSAAGLRAFSSTGAIPRASQGIAGPSASCSESDIRSSSRQSREVAFGLIEQGSTAERHDGRVEYWRHGCGAGRRPSRAFGGQKQLSASCGDCAEPRIVLLDERFEPRPADPLALAVGCRRCLSDHHGEHDLESSPVRRLIWLTGRVRDGLPAT